jgi:HlyD family secretion protein
MNDKEGSQENSQAENSPALPLSDSGKASTHQTISSVATTSSLWLIAFAILFLLVGVLIGKYVLGTKPLGATSDYQAKNGLQEPSDSVVKALGRLMPEGDIVIVAPPFGSADARVAKLLVREGSTVEKDEVIAELDNLQHLESRRSVAQANLRVAESSLTQIESVIGTSIKNLIAQRDIADEAFRVGRAEHKRISDLYNRKLLAKTDFDRSELSLVRARKDLDKAQADLDRLKGGSNQSDIDLAIQQLALAKIDYQRAEQELEQAVVKAPKAGTILRLHVRIGERPDSKGIATLGAIEKMQAELEIYQTDITKIKTGLKVELDSPALHTTLSGVISEVGIEVERQSIIGSSPAANIDARVIRAIVDLDEASSQRASSLTGLEVTATMTNDKDEQQHNSQVSQQARDQ